MDISTFILAVLLDISLFWTHIQAEELQEYCVNDVFSARCEPNVEVIKVRSALYGRMKLGKCIKKDMGYLGCSKDVSSYVAPVCAGKSECSYAVATLYEVQPCEELNAYLQVDYECIPVSSKPNHECESSSSLHTHGSQGYISSYVARKSGCGNMNHPWKIEVLPGQRVNISLEGFQQQNSKSGKCKPLGYIVERGHRNNITICSKRGGREHIYTSNGRPLHVYIDTNKVAEDESDFLLHYKVFGCADLKVPQSAWYKREGDIAIIGCETQDLRWTLKCEGSQWSGVVGNCSQNFAASVQQSASWMEGNLDLKKLTILCIAVGFIILIVIAATVIIWKWRESNQHKPPSTILLQEEQYRLNKGPLPPTPQDASHYRSLIRQPDLQAFPPHCQTMPRPQPQDMQASDDYSTDWRFGTAPWQKPNV